METRRWSKSGLLLLGLLLLAVPPLSAAGPSAAAKPAPVLAAFALVDAATAAGLSKRSATPHTRAVLIHAAANQGRSARPVGWISGEADSLQALQDLPALLDLGLAWRLGWDATGAGAAAQAKRFLDASLAWMDAWIGTCRPNWMPLNESRFDALIMSWDLLRAAASSSQTDRTETWLRKLAEGYLVDRNGQPKAEQGTYWQSHRVKLASLAAFSLGDPELVSRAEAAFCRQISLNLRADGSPIDFAEHDSLAYAVYDLQPLVISALAARLHGRDWFHFRGASGASLETALLWLSGFASSRQTHVEFAASRIEAERSSAAERGRGSGILWNPVNACTLYWLAVRLDERWLPLAARLGRDQAWLAVVLPTAEPPAYSLPSPKASTGATTKSGAAAGQVTSANTNAALNQSQLQALLQALKSGTAGAGALDSATTGTVAGTAAGGIPSLLSLIDTLGGSGSASGSDGTGTGF